MTSFSYDPGFEKITGLQENYSVLDFMRVAAVADPKTAKSGHIFSVNGIEGVNGWDLLTEVRTRLLTEKEFEKTEPFLVVVTTDKIKARMIGVASGFKSIDLLQRRTFKRDDDDIAYWWELNSRAGGRVNFRKSVTGFEAVFYNVESGMEFKAIISCANKEIFDKTIDMLKSVDMVEVGGMLVTASMDKKENENFMLVQSLVPIEDDFSAADEVLSKVSDWHQLVPMRHATTGEPLFSDPIILSMMMGGMFYRDGVPALNIVYFGPPAVAKTSALEYLAKTILGGSFEAATASSGKGWLVTHASGVTPTIFRERRCILVDELFKAASSVGGKSSYHNYAIELNGFMQKHMQVLERKEIDASSGLGVVKGKMRCSFLGSENSDTSLQKALARADSMSGGPLRRFQFGFIDAEKTEGFKVMVDTATAHKLMTSRFYKEFGPNAIKGMRALYMFSRRFTNDLSIGAPAEWLEMMMGKLFDMVKDGAEDVPKEYRVDPLIKNESDDRKLERVKQYVAHHQMALVACWVSAGVIRGWEVHGSIEKLKPVFDDRQKEMAEMVSKFLFVSKLKVLAPGIVDVTDVPGGIARI